MKTIGTFSASLSCLVIVKRLKLNSEIGRSVYKVKKKLSGSYTQIKLIVRFMSHLLNQGAHFKL